MLEPRRTKFKKQQKGKNRGKATRNNRISFGEYGLQVTGRCRITSRQIEAARKAIKRHVRRGGKLWIRVFPDKPYSSKPLEVRMGKGKGNVDYWAQPIKPGTMLFEIEGVPKNLAREAMRRAAGKLPVSTAFVEK